MPDASYPEASRPDASRPDVSLQPPRFGSVEQLRAAVTQSPVGFAITDLSGRFAEVNQAAASMLGYSRDELVGMNSRQLNVADDAAIAEHVLDTLTSGTHDAWHRRRAFVRKDGSTCWADIWAHAIYEPDGSVAGIASQIVDASIEMEQTRLREELERRWSDVIDSSAIGYVVTDVESRPIEANGAYCAFFGYTLEELHEIGLAKLRVGDGAPALEAIQSLYAGQPFASWRMEYRRKDASTFWGDARIAPIRDASGAVTGLHGALTDVSAEVADQQRLRQAEEVLEAAMARSIIGQAVVSVDRRLRRVNAALSAITGYSADELKEMRIEQLWKPGHVQDRSALAADLAAGRIDSYDFEQLCRHKSGHDVWARIHVIPLNAPSDHGPAGRIELFAEVLDITAQKQAELALAEQELKFRLIAENAGDLVLHIRDGKYVWVSPSVTRLLGWEPEELIGTPTTALCHPDHIAELPQLRADIAAGINRRVRLQLRTKSGGWLWVESQVAAHVDQGGNFDGSLSVLRDISEQMKAEWDIALRERQFRLLASNSSDIVFWLRDWKIAWVSPSVSTFGWDPAEVLGAKTLDFAHPDDISMIEQARDERELADGDVRLRFRFRHKDGSYRWIETQSRPNADEDGQADGIVVSMRDISLQVASEEAVAASQARYRMLAENAADIVVRVDSAHRRLWCSDSILSSLGWTPEEYLALPDSELTHPDDVLRIQAARDLHDSGEPALVSFNELRARHKAGRWIWMSSRSRDLPDGGRVVSIRGVDDEVRARLELKRSEVRYRELADEQQALLSALSRSNRDLEVFAFAASHDLQAPLRHISGFLGLLMNSVEKTGLTQSQRSLSDQIQLAVDRMSALTSGLLEYSKVDQLTVEPEAVSVGDVAARVADMLSVEIVSAGAIVDIDADVLVWFAPVRLQQVLQNLISNAVRYRSPERDLRVLVLCKRIGESRVEISVADNGIGISPIHQEHVFTAFKQVKPGVGSGLGLAIVSRIIETADGTISVSSDGTSGAVFTLTLPAA